MTTSFDKYQKRRLFSSYISVVLSIAFVLFLLGCLGLLLINSKKIADEFKENVTVSIFFSDDAKPLEIKQLKKKISIADYTKEVVYVSKKEAAKLMQIETGETFIDFLGFNPLKNSLDVHLKADYVTNKKISEIAESMSKKSFVDDVSYDKDLVQLINDNVKKISLWFLVFSAIFTIIAMLLINSSIRLAIYAKRFTIKTMQMVGATKRFIRRPFIVKNIILGVIGTCIAFVGMAFVLYYLDITFPELELLSNLYYLAGLFIGIFVVGFLITWISTFIATQRFLNLSTNKLYY